MKKSVCSVHTENKPKLFFRSVPYAKMLSFSFIFLSFHVLSVAQCTTFINADTSNPLLNALPAGETLVSLDFVDINGDGKMDCYVIPAQGNPQLYRNTGSKEMPQFTKNVSSGFESVITPEGSPVIQFVDIDGDADYDCFITEVSYGFRPVTKVLFYRNTGTKKKPQFVRDDASNPVDFAKSNNNYVKFTFADIDADGDLDFYYTGFYNSTLNDYDQCTYLNNGTPQIAAYDIYTNDHPHDFERQRTYFDWNRDGLPDYVKYESTLNKYEYMVNAGPAGTPVFTNSNDAPVFTNGMPYRLVDLNNDGEPEAFTADGRYSTIAPLALIKATEKKIAGIKITKLSSAEQSPSYQYHWQYNGSDIAINKPFLYAIKPGKYVLFVTSECGTGVSLPRNTNDNTLITDNKINNEELTALESKTPINFSIKAYPNPFTSEFILQIPFEKGLKNTINITDLAGKTMLTKTAMAGTLHLGNMLTKGIYILQVWQDNTMIYQTKIIKQ